MMLLKAEPMSSNYEIIQLDTFMKNLRDFDKASQTKINERIKDCLSTTPDRFPMLKGAIPLSGKKLFGLRHIKIGVKGHRGGVYVLYRVCEECLKHEYRKKSRVTCEFCDSNKPYRVVLFDVHPRSFDYGR